MSTRYKRTSDIYEVKLKKRSPLFLFDEYLSLESRLFCFRITSSSGSETYIIFDEYRHCMLHHSAHKYFKIIGEPISTIIISNGLEHPSFNMITFYTDKK